MPDDNLTSAHKAAQYIQQLKPAFKPTIGIVLGSGLGSFVECMTETLNIPYETLPGFPKLTVHGHGGELVLGSYAGVNLVCLNGRYHSYEGTGFEAVKTYVRTLKLLGCQYFLATNASGSLREDAAPGELMLITDHINFQPNNPLVGPNDEAFGPRFFPLDNAYDKTLRDTLCQAASEENILLHQGIYISVLGPNYETAAEIRAFRQLGADAIGMSTVPEVLVANHCGLKVAVVATITNYATGLSPTSHNHEAVVRTASKASEPLNRLVKRFMTLI